VNRRSPDEVSHRRPPDLVKIFFRIAVITRLTGKEEAMTEECLEPLNEEIANPVREKPQKKPKTYSRPVLTHFGDIRSSTMAPSPGTAESGLGQGFQQN
jgi:hypothetical protein